MCLDGEKNDRVAFQARADYQNHAIGWLHRGYSSLGGGKVVRFPRIWMVYGECRIRDLLAVRRGLAPLQNGSMQSILMCIQVLHVDRYVGEFAGRHNDREADTIDMMSGVVKGLEGKHLPYRDLIA